MCVYFSFVCFSCVVCLFLFHIFVFLVSGRTSGGGRQRDRDTLRACTRENPTLEFYVQMLLARWKPTDAFAGILATDLVWSVLKLWVGRNVGNPQSKLGRSETVINKRINYIQYNRKTDRFNQKHKWLDTFAFVGL